MNAEPSQQHKRHEKETHSERQTSHNQGGVKEREREREGEREEEEVWESRESFRHRAASAASWLRNGIRNRRCPSFFVPILPTALPSFQHCLISGTTFSSLATGLSVTRLVPQASCLVPGMPRAPSKPHPVAACLFDLVLAALLLLLLLLCFSFAFLLLYCIVSLCN